MNQPPYAFLVRDADLIDSLDDNTRRALLNVLHNHALEGFEPERHHVEALIRYIREEITSDEFAALTRPTSVRH